MNTNTFEFNGEQYKRASAHQKEWGAGLISQLNLTGKEHILDLGCGDGVLTKQISTLVPHGEVLGIDASTNMIETAKQLANENLTFTHMDINEMNFKNQFDIIYSNAALHWVTNHSNLLQRSYDALKSQGTILWNFGGDGNCANFIHVIRKKITQEQYAPYFKAFSWPWFMPSKPQYEGLIASIGFNQYTITEVNNDRYFPNADAIIRWIDQPSLVPFIKNVPDKKKEQFRKDVIDEMLERTRQSDGTYFETFRRIQVSAIKQS